MNGAGRRLEGEDLPDGLPGPVRAAVVRHPQVRKKDPPVVGVGETDLPYTGAVGTLRYRCGRRRDLGPRPPAVVGLPHLQA